MRGNMPWVDSLLSQVGPPGRPFRASLAYIFHVSIDPTSAPPPPYDSEGPESEWKEILPRSQRVARTLSAFANGLGGRFWVGVRDDGLAVGVGRPEEVIEELGRIAKIHLVPPQEIHLRRHPMGDRVLVEARVTASKERPVLAPGRDGELFAFHRDGASTRRAPRALIRAWHSGGGRASIEPKERRLLRHIRDCARHFEPGPTVSELSRAVRMGQRAVRRILVDLMGRGLVTEREGRRYGLTPEGYRRASRQG